MSEVKTYKCDKGGYVMKEFENNVQGETKKPLSSKVSSFAGSLFILSFAAGVSAVIVAVAVRLILWIL